LRWRNRERCAACSEARLTPRLALPNISKIPEPVAHRKLRGSAPNKLAKATASEGGQIEFLGGLEEPPPQDSTVFDGYGSIDACRKALNDIRKANGIAGQVDRIDRSSLW